MAHCKYWRRYIYKFKDVEIYPHPVPQALFLSLLWSRQTAVHRTLLSSCFLLWDSFWWSKIRTIALFSVVFDTASMIFFLNFCPFLSVFHGCINFCGPKCWVFFKIPSQGVSFFSCSSLYSSGHWSDLFLSISFVSVISNTNSTSLDQQFILALLF